jgi:2-dehydropantoate 2-reductase
MRTLIAGSGAVGLYYGARLAAAGNGVVFWARGENLGALRERGLTVRSIRGDVTLAHPALAADAAEAAAQGPFDLVLVTVKGYDTGAVCRPELRGALAPGATVLTLQNGVESAAPLAAYFGARAAAGIAFIGSERTAPGVVAHTAAGHVVIGEPGGGESERMRALAARLAGAQIDVRVAADIRLAQWRKLLWNVAFNGPTALGRCYALDLLATPEGEATVRALLRETVAVARALGVGLDAGDADETLRLTRDSGPVRTSMLVDAERGRPLEYEAIYGPPLREAKRLGIEAPVLTAVYALLAALAGPR